MLCGGTVLMNLEPRRHLVSASYNESKLAHRISVAIPSIYKVVGSMMTSPATILSPLAQFPGNWRSRGQNARPILCFAFMNMVGSGRYVADLLSVVKMVVS